MGEGGCRNENLDSCMHSLLIEQQHFLSHSIPLASVVAIWPSFPLPPYFSHVNEWNSICFFVEIWLLVLIPPFMNLQFKTHAPTLVPALPQTSLSLPLSWKILVKPSPLFHLTCPSSTWTYNCVLWTRMVHYNLTIPITCSHFLPQKPRDGSNSRLATALKDEGMAAHRDSSWERCRSQVLHKNGKDVEATWTVGFGKAENITAWHYRTQWGKIWIKSLEY